MTQNISRRDWLKYATASAAASAVLVSAPHGAYAANEKLNVAVIGIGGQGRTNLNAVRRENIVALCDVDDERAGNAYEVLPKAKKFKDYRVMLEKMDREIDAVVISTPDHTHYHLSKMALDMGKHLYLEKPMAHSVREVRELTQLAAEKGVATQLGVQRHTIENVHRVVELIQSGAIGTVTEVHSWIDSERGMVDVPTEFPAVPDHLDWELWLGPAEKRPYHPAYAPYGWRFWWDFGTGETGNWGCHILDLPYWALNLKYPESAGATGPEPHPQTSTKSMHSWFQFPARGNNPPLKLHWYQAKGGPAILQELGLPAKGNNNLFIGTEGMLLCGFEQRKLLPEDTFADFQAPDPWIPDSPGFHREWIQACKGGPKPTCDFDYSGPLTETVLLGNVAYRSQSEFQWDPIELQAKDNRVAQKLVEPAFRRGWEL